MVLLGQLDDLGEEVEGRLSDSTRPGCGGSSGRGSSAGASGSRRLWRRWRGTPGGRGRRVRSCSPRPGRWHGRGSGSSRRGRAVSAPWAEEGQAHVAEPFGRGRSTATTSCSGSRATVEPAAHAAVGDLLAEVEDTGGHAVSMVPVVLGGLAKFIDHPLLGRVGRVAHPQVDHVDPGPSLAIFQLVDLAEKVGWQAPDPGGGLRGRRLEGGRDWSSWSIIAAWLPVDVPEGRLRRRAERPGPRPHYNRPLFLTHLPFGSRSTGKSGPGRGFSPNFREPGRR